MGDDASPPARLIIVDDHDLIRLAMRAMLQGEVGLEVVGEASDGREALTLCRRLRPDLVLMDVQMPGMNGIEATREIKVEHPDTIVLMVTAFERVLEGDQECGTGRRSDGTRCNTARRRPRHPLPLAR